MNLSYITMTLLGAALLSGVALLCAQDANARPPVVQVPAVRTAQAPDSATVRLHISGMSCGTCPATARLALRRLSGVYGATVTLNDSLGVVRYDPRRLRPEQIAAHLTRLTGYGAVVLPDTASDRTTPLRTTPRP